MTIPSEEQRLIDDMSYDDEEPDEVFAAPRSPNITLQNPNYDQKELNNYEEALTKIGFGKFHYLVLFICSLANAADAVEILCVSFILPSAECDLKMTSKDKGYLSACLFLGMMIGGYVWGAISDIYGRKWILILALTFNAIFSILCGFSQTFFTLLLFRFLSGIGVGGSIPVVWSYFAEFMPKDKRGRMLCCLASAWVLGNLLVVFIAYMVLGGKQFEWIVTDSIKINNWRFFMILCASPSTLSAISILFLPESPKFNLYNFNYIKTQKTLQEIYIFNNKVNTAQDIDRKWKTFKFFEKLKHRPILTENDFFRNRENNNHNPASKFERFKRSSFNVIRQTGLLFRAPYTLNTLILLVMMFSLMFGYYGVWMWSVEIFERMKRYGGTPCLPSNDFNSSLLSSLNKTCRIDDSVFFSSGLAALSNIPGNLITIIYIDRIGRNLITITSLILSGLAVMGIAFINTSNQGLILITLFGAITTFSFNSFGCTCTELYPTTLRSTALGVQYVAGRSGAILGNLLFGLAFDLNCYIPLTTICCIMILSGLLAIKLPESKNQDIH